MANAERGTLVFTEVHSSDVQDLLGSPIHRMDPQVNFSVTFQGNTLNFLVSSKTTWADLEAMVKVSFELKNIQIKYLDEDHDEVSINTAEEYQEAVKIAMKQGSRLQINVYELRVPSGMSSGLVFGRSEEPFVPEVKKKAPIAQTLIKDKDIKRKNKRIQSERLLSEVPPEWFTSYLEKFREQVVQDTVKMLEQKLNDKLLLTNQLPRSMNTSRHQTPASSLVQGNSHDWLLSCNNCQKPIVGIRYQCSVCPTYNICELCEAGLYFHDPNHVFLKLRRPTWHISDTQSLGQLSSSLVTSEQVRFQKQMDKHFLKAEKQRLRGEKKQRKAEARELKKQFKLHQKFNLWNSGHALDHTDLAAAKSERLQSSTLLSLQRCPVVSTLSAAFVDENLPDGSHLPPKIIFMKHWRMRNTGNMAWSSDTKLKFMWGNITLMSSGKKDVIVPYLLPGEEGFVSVEFEAPATEGTYTSHWRLSHKGEQFGPRIWCSIVVDSSSNTISNLPDHGRLMPSFCQNSMSLYKEEERASEFKGEVSLANRVASSKMKRILSAREFYIPSLDLLTAQDLLSFELLDINIVQELEQVPRNTPVDSIQGPSPYKIHDCSSLPKTTVLDQKQEENERITYKLLSDAQVSKGKAENSGNQEEGEEDMSGTQFVCETVIRSLTLDAAPDHQPPQKKKSSHNSLQTLSDIAHCSPENNDSINPVSVSDELQGRVPTPEFDLLVQDGEESNGEADNDMQDEFSSRASSLSEDYIIVLPECFDTSRPLGESMYSSALSQSNLENVTMAPANPEESYTPVNSTSNTLITSQTLDEMSLNPQSGEPQLIRFRALSESSQEASFPTREEALLVPVQMREELQRYGSEVSSPENINNPSMYPESSRHSPGNSLAGGLVKGALSVAASAYKALFVGQASMDQAVSVTSENHMASFLTHLHEMGFCDRHFNLHLLQKHKCDMNLVVTELLQQNQGDWYGNPY
ncbi:next to BRCA1 gene 1 protein isoform X2 [Pantherophis guttatus]|uniref:Next to BRCA1 gene 1 protein isoform X2 n=1 Tax=Pantherophis guttatus TaxID=94885 RepID=A0ABM3ZHB2_PANGU|nr:next to BRCA1 gene 1 protein isoform X2 [Pantherophis guttatus]